MYCIVKRRILIATISCFHVGEVDYKINNSQLVKDLGVTFDPKLNLTTIYMK